MEQKYLKKQSLKQSVMYRQVRIIIINFVKIESKEKLFLFLDICIPR